MLDKLDETADPCDDFYQFACGSFIEETVIPDDRTRTSMFSILGDKLDVQVRGLLEGEIKASDPKPFQMAKSVFQSCMDKETIEVKKRNVLSTKTMCVFLGSGARAVEGDSEKARRVAIVGGAGLERGGIQVVR